MTASRDTSYFSRYQHLRMKRDDSGVLLVEMHTNGGPVRFDAIDHEQFPDAFYEIGRDRANQIVILTGVGDFMADIDVGSFGNVGDPNVWARIHDETVQTLENLANIRVPLIAAVEGRAFLHSEYALMANTIVAGKSATFGDLAHLASGVVPGDGIFPVWSYRLGAGRAETFLLNRSRSAPQRPLNGASLRTSSTTARRSRRLARSPHSISRFPS